MAIKYKDIRDGLISMPLSNEENEIVSKVEEYIDKVIKEKFDINPIRIDRNIVEFDYDPTEKNGQFLGGYPNLKSTRKKLMTKELQTRFEKAGWKWELYHGEDDGPNRPGFDYWILTGK